MLDQKTYSRKELIDLFGTNRIDAIKAKIKRQGYLFADSGRGNSYQLTIIELPREKKFKRYCVDCLGFNESVDETKLKAFINNVINNEGFISLQLNEMKEELEKQGTYISEATISNYYDQLIKVGIIERSTFDYLYYVFDKNLGHNRYITKEEYRKLYNQYWESVRLNKGYQQAEVEIRQYYGTKPKKRRASVINGIFGEKLNELERIINE